MSKFIPSFFRRQLIEQYHQSNLTPQKQQSVFELKMAKTTDIQSSRRQNLYGNYKSQLIYYQTHLKEVGAL